jgi:enoyl-CoA hydratase/carnithine racemase
MLTGRRYDAQTGERLGLAHYIAEEGKTFEKGMELAEIVAANAPFANYTIVQALPRIEKMSASDGLWTESMVQALSLVPDDARKGMEAYLDHRKIEF